MSSNQQSFIIYRASIKLLFEGSCKFTKLKKNLSSALGIAILQNTSCCAILITTIFIQYILIHFNCYTNSILPHCKCENGWMSVIIVISQLRLTLYKIFDNPIAYNFCGFVFGHCPQSVSLSIYTPLPSVKRYEACKT